MIIKYSPDEKIKLSLKEKVISKEVYEDDIEKVVQYGRIKNNLRASVIIVAYNEGDDLIRNLRCWEKQVQQYFEIILVDNGLDDKIVEKIKDFDILYVKANKNLGCCSGRNVGAVYANSDILVFGDADGYNPDNYIENVLLTFEDKSIIATRGKVLPINEKLQETFMPNHYDLGDEKISSLIDAEGNSVWRTEDYIKVGGFEDSLAGGEGIALQYRMIEFFGYDKDVFLYNPKLILYHDYYQDDKKLEYKIRQNAIVRKQLHNKYPFLDSVISYYSNKCKFIKKTTHSADVNKKVKFIDEELEDEYNKHINEQKKQRYQNRNLIKGKNINFSIIIPCYNLGKLLPKAIDSVFAQTLEDIEVIVVDDASPDKKTQKILDKVEKYVQVIRLKENSGVSVARNVGIEKAKSEYILCLDADDTIEPTYLEKAKNIFDSDENIGLVSSWVQYFGDSDILSKPKDWCRIKDALVNSPVHTATCFRKDLHYNGGGYDITLRGYEDWDHWIRIMKQGYRVRVIPEPLFNYFVRPNSKVKTSHKNSFKLTSEIIENHFELFRDNFEYVIAKKHEILNEQNNKKQKGLYCVRIKSRRDVYRLIKKIKNKIF